VTFELIYGSSVSPWDAVLSSQLAKIDRWNLKQLQLQATFGPYRGFLDSGANIPSAWTITVEQESVIEVPEVINEAHQWRSRLAANAVTVDLFASPGKAPVGDVIARLLRAGCGPQLNQANHCQFLKPGRLLVGDRTAIDAVARMAETFRAVAIRWDDETLEIQRWPEVITEGSLGPDFVTSQFF
jgi:hypothetical protein